VSRYPRGILLSLPLTCFALAVWCGSAHEAILLVWDRQRVERGIPSVFD
jgi:hypothetical protein